MAGGCGKRTERRAPAREHLTSRHARTQSRRRPALPRRGRGAALGAGPAAGRLPGDRRRQRVHRRLGRDRRGARRDGRPRAAARVRRRRHAGLLAATADVVCFWTPTARSTPRSCPGSLDPVRAGDADLVLGRRRPVPRRLAAARPGRQRRARPHAARRAPGCACTTSARCAPPAARRCWALGLTDRRFGYPLEMVVRAAEPAGASTRSTSTTPPRPGHRPRSPAPCSAPAHRPRHARGAGPMTGRAQVAGDRQGAGARPGQDPAEPAVYARAGGRHRRGRPGRHPRRGGAAPAAGRVVVLDGAPRRPARRLRGGAAGRGRLDARLAAAFADLAARPARRARSAWTPRRSRPSCCRWPRRWSTRRTAVSGRRRTAAGGRWDCPRPGRAAAACRCPGPTPGVLTREGLTAAGLTVLDLPELTDIDHFPDAMTVAARVPAAQPHVADGHVRGRPQLGLA